MKNIFDKFLIQPKIVISIFLITAIIVFVSSYIEYYQSKKEINKLMEEQSHTLLNAILVSSQNAIKSYEQIKNEINDRLLNNALLIKHLYESNKLSNDKLYKITQTNNLFRINVFSSKGKKLFASHSPSLFEQNFQNKSKEILKEIFNGETDTLQIGIRESQINDSYKYVIAIATKNRDAIVVNIDANKLIQIKNELGFGPLLKEFTKNKNILYLVFQNENGIIAGSGNFEHIEDIDSSKFLQKSFLEQKFYSRIIKSDSINIFESVHPLIVNYKKLGIIRLGLSTEPLEQITQKTINRIIIQSILLLIFGFITLSFIFFRQNYDSLSRKFKSIETYFKNIFDNVSDSIILLNKFSKIEALNNSSLLLFECDNKDQIEKIFNYIFEDILSNEEVLFEKELNINNKIKYLLISKTSFIDDNVNKFILVIKDITHQKVVEKHKIRNQQLIALSELSSSVAHEIRNPLNAIATITQQIGKDFSVKENEIDFKELTGIVYKEVKRINYIIENFLKFAKPIPLNPEYFSLVEFFNQLKIQYQNIFSKKNITLELNILSDISVKWDIFQIKQVFLNLIENSIDALDENGTITISTKKINNNLEIKFTDNGKGIPEEIIDKIFNIYFTTKQSGNGLGLSIVQKIISEHNGFISVSSKLNHGTTFIIILPLEVEG